MPGPAPPAGSQSPGGPTSTVLLGKVPVSRFIVGHNPPCANSHWSNELNAEMREYFTADNVVALYRRAEALGVRTVMIRGSYDMLDWVELHRREGGRMNVIGQTASEMHGVFSNIRVMAAAGVEAVYHHGTQTDKFWREGRIDDTVDYLKCMRDSGVAVGLGTHQPEIVDYAQQHGWDLDFYVPCIYNLSRVARESMAITGRSAYDTERYLPEDRDEMCRTIRGVDKPCVAFKVLAATRHCRTQDDVREAFRYIFTHIKATDAISVGLFPKHIDQVALDLEYCEDACRAAAAK